MGRLHDPKQHDDLLNFRLKRLFALGGAPAIRLCEGRYGVTRQEWRLVAALVEDGPMSPSMLVERVRIDPARVSRNVSSLLDKGLIERSAGNADRRRATLRATGAGQQLYAELFPQLAAINRRLMEALDEHEAIVLDECLRKLTELAQRIHDHGGGVDVRSNRRLGGSRRVWAREGPPALKR